MHLNHIHLCVPDVAAVSAFLVDHFGLRVRETRGRNGFAVLTDGHDLVLALMRLPSDVDPEQAWPPMFHVGFLIADEVKIERAHASLTAAGFEPSPIDDTRGGRRFYCKTPGGLLIEVGQPDPVSRRQGTAARVSVDRDPI